MFYTMNRRKFIKISAAGFGSLLINGCNNRLEDFFEGDTESIHDFSGLPPARIHRVYIAGMLHNWPKPDFDVQSEVAKFEKHISKIEREIKDVKFIGGEVLSSKEEIAAVAATVKNADGILIIPLTVSLLLYANPFLETKKPAVIFSQPFSGHAWIAAAEWQRSGQNSLIITSSDYRDITRAIRLLRVPAHMSKTRVVLLGTPIGSEVSAQKIEARFGTKIVPVSKEQYANAYYKTENKIVEAGAERYWIRSAKKIVEPSREDLLNSARTYFALKNLMVDNQAQAITVGCLGSLFLLQSGYPCLAFSRLDDLGLVAGCEADLDSLLTKLIIRYAFNKPGFISDPVIDTATNTCIHAHCTAPTKMDGPEGKRAPYIIRSHRGDNRSASMEVQMRVGEQITVIKLVDLEYILIFNGTITDIPDFDDRGCRTQFSMAVSDAKKLLANWGGGIMDDYDLLTKLHRVCFYGNHVKEIEDLAVLMQLKVVREI